MRLKAWPIFIVLGIILGYPIYFIRPALPVIGISLILLVGISTAFRKRTGGRR
jgi:hypothetical protein